MRRSHACVRSQGAPPFHPLFLSFFLFSFSFFFFFRFLVLFPPSPLPRVQGELERVPELAHLSLDLLVDFAVELGKADLHDMGTKKGLWLGF
jgi:hypothetical protein